MHVLEMFQGTLSCCGHQVLNVVLDKNFLQQHNIKSFPLPDLLSNEPVSDIMCIQHKFSHATAILLQKQEYSALGFCQHNLDVTSSGLLSCLIPAKDPSN